MAPQKAARVIVRYDRSRSPFETQVPLSETVGQLKTRSLETFGLFEGGPTFYDLYHGPRVLADMNESLDQVAGEHSELELRLVKQYHG